MRFIEFTALAFLGLTFGLRAQPSPSNNPAASPGVYPLSLEETIRFAVDHNLSLQIERYNPQIASFNLAGSYSYYDPAFNLEGHQNFKSDPGGFDPTINQRSLPRNTWVENFASGITGKTPTGMRYDLNSTLTRSSGSDAGFQYRPETAVRVTQPLLKDFWTDQSRTQIKINKRQLKISELALELQLMDTVLKAQQAYYDLIFATENIKVMEKALELAQRSAAENKRRVEVGTLAPLDEKETESQAAAAQANLILARSRLATAENVVKSLFTDDYTKWHNIRLEPSEKLIAIPEIFNLQESWNNGIARRPDYNQLKEELEKQNLILKFDHNQLFPSLDLVGSFGRAGLDRTLGDSLENIREGDFPRWGGGAVLKVPFSRTLERNNYARTKVEKKQAILRLKQKEQEILVQIDDSVAQARSNFDRIDATRQAREFAEAALVAGQKKLENGRSTTFEILGLQDRLTKARFAEIQALADYNKSIAELYRQEGTTLERNRVNLIIK